METYVFIIEDGNGAIENTAEITKDRKGLHIKFVSARNLSTGEPCQLCSTARFIEYLNNVRELGRRSS